MSKKNVPVKKNETVTIQFEDLTSEGSGVGKIDGYPLFVPLALPGEKATVRVVKANKNYGFGKLIKVLEASPDRVDPAHQCGGCQLQHMSYPLQLKMKQDQVKNVMKKIAHLDDVPVHPVLGMEHPWGYRNKVQLPVGEKDGRLITGFYQPRSHRIMEMDEPCNIQDEMINGIIDTARDTASQLGISAYNEKAHTGVLRHLMVRIGKATHEAMIVFITRSQKLPHHEKLVEAIREKHPEVKSIMHNINSKRTNVIFDDTTKLLWGDEYIHDKIDDLTFAISARSFYQVNPGQTEVLYHKALEYAAITEEDIVIDAFCGIGTISLLLAKKAKKVYGVEIVPEAISDAKKNARLNGITNAEFIVGAAEKVMPWWTAQGLKPDVIVVDPPRKGCEEVFLKAMIDMQPKRIVYVSCNPSTLARDLRILEDGGYKTKEVQPVDMFGMTPHVECVAVLTRVSE